MWFDFQDNLLPTIAEKLTRLPHEEINIQITVFDLIDLKITFKSNPYFPKLDNLLNFRG